MTRPSKIPLVLALFFCSLPLLAQDAAANASARSPVNQLQQLTTQLQQSPGDQALREKIIALALTLNPKPATPTAATQAEGAAEYAFKNAKANSNFSDAAKQYEKALLLAPWLAADYFNCGVAHEKAGENKEAIRNFSLYLLAAPNADDAQAVNKRIGGLQYAAQESEDAASEQARAANEQVRAAAQLAAVYQGLDGGVWQLYGIGHDSNRPFTQGSVHARVFIEIHGHQIEMYDIDDANPGMKYQTWNITFTKRQFYAAVRPGGGMSSDVTISEDGQSILLVNKVEDNPRWFFHRIK
jgi:tetratricopeptide (TPR) repeat protein